MTRSTSAEADQVAVQRAEQKAGVEIRLVSDIDQVKAAADLWMRIWNREGEPPVNADLLRALTHAGNYLSGAYAEQEMVGALLGFFGAENGTQHLHSHILGVDPGTRAHGVGFALKLHQRTWALERGIGRVNWTFDPLVRANGFFNLFKLAAEGVEYLVDFYGSMPDAINNGDQSDRILVSWDLASPKVEKAARGAARESSLEDWIEAGAVVALDAGANDQPVRQSMRGDIILCPTPSDIVALRRADPGLAREWRKTVREVMLSGVERGLRITAMTRSGWYVLMRG